MLLGKIAFDCKIPQTGDWKRSLKNAYMKHLHIISCELQWCSKGEPAPGGCPACARDTAHALTKLVLAADESLHGGLALATPGLKPMILTLRDGAWAKLAMGQLIVTSSVGPAV